MGIRELKLRQLARDVLLDLVSDLKAPTAEAVISGIRERSTGLDLSRPITSQSDFIFAEKEVSSATKFNNATRTVYQDIELLYYALSEAEDRVLGLLEKTGRRMTRLEEEVQRMLSRAEDRLLTEDNSEGYVLSVSDNFSTMELIDRDASTVSVDTANRTVFSGTSENSRVERIDMSGVRIDTAVVSDGGRPFPGTVDGSTSYMLNNEENTWVYLATTETGVASVAATIETEGAGQFNRIDISLGIRDQSVDLLVQYSNDGVAWTNLVEEGVRTVADVTSYRFPLMAPRLMRFVLTKYRRSSLSQSGRPIFSFGVKRIAFCKETSSYSSETVLQSQDLEVPIPSGGTASIRKAALEAACESIPPGTSISYLLSLLDSGGSVVKEAVVTPANRNAAGQNIVEAVLEEEQLTSQINWGDTISVVGQARDALRALDFTASEGVIRVWRDVGTQSVYRNTYQADGLASEAGWYFDGAFYHTFVELERDRIIDLGPSSSAYLDGVLVSGEVKLTEGLHSFSTHLSNWRTLKGIGNVTEIDPARGTIRGSQSQYGADGLGSAITAGETLTIKDDLYPYNHKLLIEGVTYSSTNDVSPVVYRGVDRFGILMTEKELTSNITSEGLDSHRSLYIVGPKSSRKLVVVIDPEQGQSAASREEFFVERSLGAAAKLRLTATLRTSNSQITPSLGGYTIKVVE